MAFCKVMGRTPDLSVLQRSIVAKGTRARRLQRNKVQRQRTAEDRIRPRLELLGSIPPIDWLVSVGVTQAALRTLHAQCVAMHDAVSKLTAGVGALDVRELERLVAVLQVRVMALMPVTVCPYCRADERRTTCQPCRGIGAMNAHDASQVPPDLLHDE